MCLPPLCRGEYGGECGGEYCGEDCDARSLRGLSLARLLFSSPALDRCCSRSATTTFAPSSSPFFPSPLLSPPLPPPRCLSINPPPPPPPPSASQPSDADPCSLATRGVGSRFLGPSCSCSCCQLRERGSEWGCERWLPLFWWCPRLAL